MIAKINSKHSNFIPNLCAYPIISMNLKIGKSITPNEKIKKQIFIITNTLLNF
jgi:hypothetical protein